ncbi:unnamed protein product [Phytophthora fragariaefolia]|uniref:3,4-dihydroxy-2-butanone-4-phosphate synthase n=1 Tax=Phytophthora fragariaefolia TaxID=1490495 RepID=A0A9W6U1E8_9STRA|nr:unnamed protein product [Phytophthora fragariaefolia]
MATGTTANAVANNAGTTPIEDALETMRQGGFVVVMDNEDRENEGDLIAAAEFATEERLAFMLRHSTGIVCVPALPPRLEELQLPLMVQDNTEAHKCKFAITVDLKEGNSTGVSAADRARTIRALADRKVGPAAFNRPGHIFPLLAQEGGVMVRAGHTEAAIDLARLAGVKPVGYLCEMMGDDGRMLRRPQLQEFSQKHDLPLVTISDLIRYRSRMETLVQRIEAKSTKVSTPFGEFSSEEYQSLVQKDQTYHALVYGDVHSQKNVPVFLVEDGFNAGLQVKWAQKTMSRHGSGVLIYIHGASQLLQVSGELMARQSIFGMAMQIVRDLEVASVRLLTTEESILEPNGFGVEIVGSERLSMSAAAPSNAGTSSIEAALEAVRRGGFVVVMDNEDRENEGDLIAAAEFATEQRVAFMLRHSTGIVCVPALAPRLQELQLPLMVQDNTEVHKCKFTVTVDLQAGNSTGVSAAGRARTIRALADPGVGAAAFNRPGHIFPLLAQHGGVMVRAGHTEAATDLARLAGVRPVGYICEMNDHDGRMMRRPQLQDFAREHDVPLITISDLIRYRARTETLVQRAQGKEAKVPTPFGLFSSIEYASLVQEDQAYHALVLGDVRGKTDVPVFLVEDGFEASLQAQWAQHHISRHGHGVLIYVHGSEQLLQISGELMARQSIFGMAMQVTRDLEVASVRLLSATELSFNPDGFGIEIAGTERLATSA